MKLAAEEEKYYRIMRIAFKLIAPFYDWITRPLAESRTLVANWAPINEQTKILDVATGTGEQALAFGKKGGEVVGVDLSEAMLKRAIRKNNYKNVRFELADATRLPFADNTFDIVSISFGLHEMPLSIIEKTLDEMTRVTKKHGKIVIVDYGLPNNKLRRFLAYNFIRLYETKHYNAFIALDLNRLLNQKGIKIEEQVMILSGIGRCIRGILEKE